MLSSQTEREIAEWALGDDTGLSSKFLAACALGDPDLAEMHWPRNNGDFGRCYRLAFILSDQELDDALQMAAGCSPKWAAVANHWEEMCDLFDKDNSSRKLYKLMNDIGL